MTQDRLLRLLGLGVRGRGAVVGVERVREAALKGTLVLAVVAPDASRHSLEKVRPLLRARGVPVVDGPGASALGHAVGREATAVVGVLDPNLANGIQRMLGASPMGGDANGAPGGARPEG
ncbi:ribosomal L7Ae/L30e/S12e/Gadd45 family protein [Roseisolibacter sp. H3M3-2]|uniref:L7Ae/L30e/S12e/Gadd45 family ribosomal protein n=1 Tax=Roseisolibacter sp. H3M3-2 TaxID=3031323 RepID=UPI0023DBEEA2|nr:ribosomal L7Ae/L30e/S12e/Gadd45 family protein [Roseisolibacter sp. H3M3-2]MDF1502509.1 ribosomal L7Ae/L30e/S12e/Gadd45 family protein [Roseisolibacter sp. H3M3-2]